MPFKDIFLENVASYQKQCDLQMAFEVNRNSNEYISIAVQYNTGTRVHIDAFYAVSYSCFQASKKYLH